MTKPKPRWLCGGALPWFPAFARYRCSHAFFTLENSLKMLYSSSWVRSCGIPPTNTFRTCDDMADASVLDLHSTAPMGSAMGNFLESPAGFCNATPYPSFLDCWGDNFSSGPGVGPALVLTALSGRLSWARMPSGESRDPRIPCSSLRASSVPADQGEHGQLWLLSVCWATMGPKNARRGCGESIANPSGPINRCVHQRLTLLQNCAAF
mmetsp:Transcript_39363/g.111330  ORF Transcript_39363/g.111330 Transcript_39363/m.111330 type:complete len:209 (-) Transcript_39363:12-638(-)